MPYPFKPENSEILEFEKLMGYLRSEIKKFPDRRTGNNSSYSIEDAALGVFSIFFTQSPSFLSFQKAMQASKGINNAQSIFGVQRIPCDNHIRTLLDPVSPSFLFPVFHNIFKDLNASGHLNTFRSINNNLLVVFDGTQTFSSQKIHCENCSKAEHKNGTVTYSHKVITPVIVAPGNEKVISLEPEFLTPQDGHDKQDSEFAAAKRWIHQHALKYSGQGISFLGDDLFCHQPLCELALSKGFNFIFVCKPDSHKTLYNRVDELEAIQKVNKVIVKRRNGKTKLIDTYRFINQVPLRGGDDALMVNWCELTTTKKDGTIVYKNAFATNHEISADNVIEIVKAGRAHWKIENENNNVLKTKGYHLEHNFGHGEQHLSSLMVTFNLLAFLFHTVLGMMDDRYQRIREKLPSRKTFFDDIRALTRYLYFGGWDELLIFMMRGLELEPRDSS